MISFAQYKGYTICLISFSKFSDVLSAFTFAGAIDIIWSIYLVVSILRPLSYFALYLAKKYFSYYFYKKILFLFFQYFSLKSKHFQHFALHLFDLLILIYDFQIFISLRYYSKLIWFFSTSFGFILLSSKFLNKSIGFDKH